MIINIYKICCRYGFLRYILRIILQNYMIYKVDRKLYISVNVLVKRNKGKALLYIIKNMYFLQ